MAADQYLSRLGDKLREIQSQEGEAIARAAEALADVLIGDGLVYVFGCGHSAALSMDLFYRAGGLMLVHPIFDDRVLLDYRPVTQTSEWERQEGWAPEVFAKSGAHAGDAIIVFSTSGRNGAPVDMAITAKEAGLTVIAVTSVAYAASLPSRHSSGQRLHEVADYVLDNHVDPGDAEIALPGLEQSVGPTSTALSSALGHALIVETMGKLLEKGVTPPVYMSANIPGGSEHNEEILSRYRDRIRFL